MNDLSTAGERRRDAILADVLRAARRRRRHKAAIRALTIAVPIAFVALLLVRPVAKPRTAIAPPSVPPMRPATAAAPESSIVIARIADDPTALARHTIVSMPPTSIVFSRIGDDELLRELNAAGRRAGLASIGGRRLLLLDGEPITAAR